MPPVNDNKSFAAPPRNVSFPALEEDVLEFWKSESIYQQSLDQRAGGPKYVFYEGPPTANGKPHPGHCLTRAIKDLFPRYKTMKGFYCERKAGWDTHGLPVEVEVCKELGIHSKEEIEAYGIEAFIAKCQQSVWQYMRQWEQLTERIGFWVRLDEAYVTYHKQYVESVWWSLKTLFDRGLLYEGHKIIWWWAQGGTALSSGEVGQGYKTVKDPSVYVRFPLVDRDNTSLLVWTTTPWTLPSNQYAAVKGDIQYALVHDAETDQNLIFAADLVETIAGKLRRELKVIETFPGSDLIGQRYVPPFDYFYRDLADATGKKTDGTTQHLYWHITDADFVTTDSGTGAVHEAPAFGEVDYELLAQQQQTFEAGQGPELFCPVAPDGKFTEPVTEWAGTWVKDADKPITRALKESGLLVHLEQYEHEYPFCWRADSDPLIQYPRRSWFIRTSDHKADMLANNAKINWLPDHIRDGRFGNFLETNVDWALSRERYWGTPLPVWKCEATSQYEAIGNYDELLAKPGVSGTDVWDSAKAANPELPDDLKVHKPYIDAVTYDSPFESGATMRRVTEVIDCWYDSGAMPFAQWGYPHTGAEQFGNQFPADFISEALDQTRGWFYSQLAISTLLFGEPAGEQLSREYPHPFRNCIVLGLMLAQPYYCPACDSRFLDETKVCPSCGGKKIERKTEKMSKSLRNYREPQTIFDSYGADALRWYFFANQPPWTSIIYSERSIRESIPEFLLRLFNVYKFFVEYANIDGFAPSASVPQAASRHTANTEIDTWIISELHLTITTVTERMDGYDNYNAAAAINRFVDLLSNWYLRRSRDRFWASETDSPDKLAAYTTLHTCLVTIAELAAPFVPFISEHIWQNLTQSIESAPRSVHLCDYPVADPDLIDEDLSRRMDLLRQIASLGLSARANEKLKVRQPLSAITAILGDTVSDEDQSWLDSHAGLLKTELNVRDVVWTRDAGDHVTYNVVPNFKSLGPRVGKLMPQVKKAFGDVDGGAMLASLSSAGTAAIQIGDQSIELTSDDVEVRLIANPGRAAAEGNGVVVVLSTELTPELVRAGQAREIVRMVQDHRKELDLERTDRITLNLFLDDADLSTAIEENRDYIGTETLTTKLTVESLASARADAIEKSINEIPLRLSVAKTT